MAVERLARDGYSLVINYAGNATAADETVAAVQALGAEAFSFQADVADEVAVTAMFDEAENTFGGIDVVVHTAGRMTLAPVIDIDLDELDSLHRTNIRGTFVVDQQAARRLRPGGAIINFSTSVVGTQFPTYGAYTASKGAVEALTLILARELRGRDITVNAIAPAPPPRTSSSRGRTRRRSSDWPTPCRSNVWDSPATLPKRSPSWPAPPDAGSTARTFVSTADSSEKG